MRVSPTARLRSLRPSESTPRISLPLSEQAGRGFERGQAPRERGKKRDPLFLSLFFSSFFNLSRSVTRDEPRRRRGKQRTARPH